jgi:predicted Co/Zn/Cd cation transporter (cation efflux family)
MKNRSVVEIMVLVFTGLVAFTIVALGTLVAIIELRDPDQDTQPMVQSLFSLISATLGALLGLIAGRSTTNADEFNTRPNDQHPTNITDDANDLYRRPPPRELPK